MGRPNLLLFTPDQLRADALGCFGNPVAQTPHLDALAGRGTRFHSAWSQHSVCGPSRVSIMTGWYPHTAGHRTLDRLLKPWEPNLLRCLKDTGYDVAMPGNRGDVFAPGVTEASTDFCGNLVEPTWTWGDMRIAVDEDHPLYRGFWFGSQGDEPRLDGDEATVQTAIRWLEERADERPWAMWVPLLAPHPPFMVEEPWYSMHDRADMPAPIPVESGLGKPGFMDEYRRRYRWNDLTDGHLAEIAATYYGMVSRVDDQLGRLLAAVDRTGHGEDTVTFCFSDHGEYLGDYRLVEKWPSGLDPSLVRNPFIAAGPGVGEHKVAFGEVEMVDLLPTCLELAEAEASHTHFGRSLTGLFADPTAPHRDAAFCEGGFNPADEPLLEVAGWIYRHKSEIQHDLPHLVGKAECVRTPEWTYVYRHEEGDELYDRSADPAETTSLLATDRAGGDDVVAVVAELRARLLAWMVETSDAFPWEADPRFPEIAHGWRDPN
jgi:arylsulfatase A-like enzyme|tara:strand:+ start:7209 stop:8675 length:1467 start_codon:yes stop_codon:yes gene_type:complete